MPIYFTDEAGAVDHAKRAQKLLGGLPGMDTMQVEELSPEGEWAPTWRADD
jgi:hypothetical protein